MDNSYPSVAGMGSQKHWILTIEESMYYTRGNFLKEKPELKDVMMSLIKYLKATYRVNVSYVNCDNAGKNEAVEWLCKQEGIGLYFKYTTPDTLQQNG